MFRADHMLILSYKIATRLPTHFSSSVNLKAKPSLAGSMPLTWGHRDTILLLNASAYVTIGNGNIAGTYSHSCLCFWMLFGDNGVGEALTRV